jgi:Ca-activated chloride channel family protein
MKSVFAITMAIALFLPSLLCSAAGFQKEESEIKLRVDLVLLDALVMQQKTGRIIGNLTKDDFTLYEDNVKQQITHFSQDTLPLSIILLVDRAGCLDPYSEQMQKAALAALQRLKYGDEVALMTFADTPELVTPFRNNKERAIDALNHLPEHNEEGEHCFNRAFYEAATYMKKASNAGGRRVIIPITGITKSINCSGPSSDEVRHALLESGSVVCPLIPKTAEQRFENGAVGSVTSMAGIFKVPTLNLTQLAEETGGEVFNTKPDSLDKAFTDLIDHLRSRYSLGFVSSNPKNDGKLRKLKLEVSAKAEKHDGKLVIKTRHQYIAGKE